MSTELRVGGVPEHFNLPWRLALADGAFRRARCPVRFVEYAGGTGDMTRALRENELDMAVVLTEGALADVVNHGVNRLVKIFVSTPLVWGIHVAAHSPIRRVEDTRGKRYAISRFGSGSHLIAIVDTLERGWPMAKMAFAIVDNLDGARKALASGKADVFLWEKFMTKPLVDRGEFRRVGERVAPWPAFAVSVRHDVVRRRATSVRRVLELVERYALNLKRRKDAASMVAAAYGLQAADAATWLAQVRWRRGFQPPVAALNRALSALEAQGTIIGKKPTIDALWHRL